MRGLRTVELVPMIKSMKLVLVAVLALSSVACGLEVKNPETQTERTNQEQREFYAKQNETRAQNQAEQRVSEEKSKEKNARLDAEDAKRKADYEARVAQQKEETAANRAEADRQYEEKRVQAAQVDTNRYAVRQRERDKKDAEAAAAVEVEIAQCKANPKCTWERVSVPLCQALKDKRAYQQDMAREKANPSGFVNARYLRELGAQIQTDDDNIAMFRKDYREQMGRTFNEGACPK